MTRCDQLSDERQSNSARSLRCQLAGRNWAQSLDRMEAIGIPIADVVDEVEAAAEQTKRECRKHRARDGSRFEQLAAKDETGENDAVLEPLRGPHRAHDGAGPGTAAAASAGATADSGTIDCADSRLAESADNCRPVTIDPVPDHSGARAVTSNSPAAFQSSHPLTPNASAASIWARTSAGPYSEYPSRG